LDRRVRRTTDQEVSLRISLSILFAQERRCALLRKRRTRRGEPNDRAVPGPAETARDRDARDGRRYFDLPASEAASTAGLAGAFSGSRTSGHSLPSFGKRKRVDVARQV
jgi:hypothetical protein